MISSFRDEYMFLSNFYNVNFIYDGLEFSNSEAAYQAAKSSDFKVREEFVWYKASVAKKYGRQVKMRADFEENKITIMQNIIACKFVQNPDLLQKLIDTGDEVLVEGNTWHDNYWGVCRCGRAKCNGGKNMLGRILMSIRDTANNNMSLLKTVADKNKDMADK